MDGGTKLARVRLALHLGDDIAALRIVKDFPRLGPERDVLLTGWNAHRSPAFYRQLGMDPDALVRAAWDAIRAKYGIPEERAKAAADDYDAIREAGFVEVGCWPASGRGPCQTGCWSWSATRRTGRGASGRPTCCSGRR